MLPLAEGNAIHVYIPSRHLHREQGDPRKILFPFCVATGGGLLRQKCPSMQIISTKYLDYGKSFSCYVWLKEKKNQKCNKYNQNAAKTAFWCIL